MTENQLMSAEMQQILDEVDMLYADVAAVMEAAAKLSERVAATASAFHVAAEKLLDLPQSSRG